MLHIAEPTSADATRRTRKRRSQSTRSNQPGENLHLRVPYITRGIPNL